METKVSSGDIIDTLGRLDDCQAFIDLIREAALDDSSPANCRVLENATLVLVAITDFLRISIVYLQTNALKKVGDSLFGKDDVSKGKKDLDDVLQRFKDSVQVAAGAMTLKNQQEAENQLVLDSISLLNFEKRHSEINQQRLNGTGLWVLGEPVYKEWWASEKSILWCHGLR
jgi:hypothetical protein